MHDTNHMARHIEWKQSSSLNVYRRRVALWNWTRNAHFENMRGNAGRAHRLRRTQTKVKATICNAALALARYQFHVCDTKAKFGSFFSLSRRWKKRILLFLPPNPNPFIHFGAVHSGFFEANYLFSARVKRRNNLWRVCHFDLLVVKRAKNIKAMICAAAFIVSISRCAAGAKEKAQ